MTATPSIDNTNLSIDLITHPTPTSNTEIPSSICYVKQMELELDQELDKMKHSKINDSILIDGTHTNTTTTLPTPITTTHTAAMTTTPGSLKQQQQQLHLQQHIVNPIMNKPLSQQIPMISSLHNPLVHQTPLGIKVQQQQQPMLHPTQKVQQQPVLNNTQLLQQPFLQSTESLKSLTLKATAQPHIAASDKAKNLLVATWLTENYELNGSHSIPRSGLYDHYQSYCLDHRIEPVNSASFGKLIRTVFPNLKTRRLGNRGKSKYHYCGIRVKLVFNAMGFPIMDPLSALGHSHHQNMNHQYHPQFTQDPMQLHMNILGYPQLPLNQQILANQEQLIKLPVIPAEQLFIVPDFLDAKDLPQDVDEDLLESFNERYKTFCTGLIADAKSLKLQEMNSKFRVFWGDMSSDDHLYLGNEFLIDIVLKYDTFTYDAVLRHLVPNILIPLPLMTIQSIRKFLKVLEKTLSIVLKKVPQVIIEQKQKVLKVFTLQLKRYTSLNYMSQSVTSAFGQPDMLSVMVQDWNKIDFEIIKEQGSWITECPLSILTQIFEVEIRNMIQSDNKVESWLSWTDDVTHRVLSSIQALYKKKSNSGHYLIEASKEFILKWNFYSGLILRELTMKSASSFGTFHLLKILLDEYIYHIIETKLCTSNELPPSYSAPGGF